MLKENSSLFSADELIRYSRHFSLPDFGEAGQMRLKKAKVLCVGVGGLGSIAATYLVAAGVGHIGVIDGDKVELSNLQRQPLFTHQDIAAQKAAVAQKRLNDLNSQVHITTYVERLTPQNAFDIIQNYDVVLDCADNYATRYLVNDVCFHLKKPDIFASIFQYEGQCSVFLNGVSPCYRCLYAAPPPADLVPNCAEGGVLGVLPGLMGIIQATEAIKLILGTGEPLTGRLLLYRALEMQFREVAIKIDPNCLLCGKQQAFAHLPRYQVEQCAVNMTDANSIPTLSVKELQQWLAGGKQVMLLDVREPYEYQICHLDATLIPLQQLTRRYQELDPAQEIVVYCKSGGRSAKAVQFLQTKGFNKLFNLEGGILAWAREIDSTLTSY